MSRHDLVSAWNHAEDMVAVSPLTPKIQVFFLSSFSLSRTLKLTPVSVPLGCLAQNCSQR